MLDVRGVDAAHLPIIILDMRCMYAPTGAP